MIWWFRYKKVLDYLKYSNDEKLTKEKTISKNEFRLENEIKELDEEKLISFLFDEKVPNSAKKLIIKRIEEIFSSSYYEESMSKIITILKKEDISKSKLKEFYREFGKNSVSSVIASIIYEDNLEDLVFDKKRSKEEKELLLDLKFSTKEICKILTRLDKRIEKGKNVNESRELINYIITDIEYDSYDLRDIIRNEEVPEQIKKDLVQKQINISNITKMLSTLLLPPEVKETIYETKRDVIDEFIRKLNKETIIDYFDSYNRDDKLSELILERKKDLITSIIKEKKVWEIYTFINKTRCKEIVDLIIELREQDFIESLLKEENKYILFVLNNSYIDDKYKNIVLEQKRKDVEKRIKDTSIRDIMSYIKSTHMPDNIKRIMLELRKEEVIREINALDDEDLKLVIYYDGDFSNYLDEYRELVIKLKVNENNLKKILKDGNYGYRIDKTKHVIDVKNDIIRKRLKELDFKTLTKKNLELRDEIVDYIFLINKDIIDEIILREKFDIEEVGILIQKNNINDEIKKALLRTHNIPEENLNSIIELIETSNSVIVMTRYEEIKEFIESLDISFKSFMQYGSGSTKYKGWLKRILYILDNNKYLEFLSVVKYYFKNYYYEDNSKENNVYIIDNLQEILFNYERYYDLTMYLVNNNIVLDEELIGSLKLLFNSKIVENVKTIEELKNYRKKVYLNNKLKVDNIEMYNIIPIKNIFYDIFGNTEVLSKIEGSKGLETLKTYNRNNKYLCNYIDEVLKYVRIIELVKYSNNRESLIKVLKYLYSLSFDEFMSIQNEFNNLDKKIRRLYELDSMVNLTNINEASLSYDMHNKELESRYGGTVLDFSDKNYCLYAHILSSRETMEDLLNGRSTGKRNFISLSPISYYGQKYYFDYDDVILLFDEVKKGSFVCSSLSNFGSNRLIKENSSEVEERFINQKGILETSAVTKNNAEALFYREGLIPKAIALPGGRKPSNKEQAFHEKYNLPYVITQKKETPVENVKKVFKPNDKYNEPIVRNNKIENILSILEPKINIIKENDKYTGREIGIFTDSHALYEPTIAILEDMRLHGITEIYSLGDNIGSGPNPDDIIDMLDYYRVSSVMGNSEYYNTLGTSPFTYLTNTRLDNEKWTKEKLGTRRIERIRKWTPSIDIEIGGKKVGLCHFGNDVRWDYVDRSTWTYQDNFELGKNARQFLYTNSEEAKRKIQNSIRSNSKDQKYIKGLLDAQKSPMFNGKKITDYDAILQGHVHFNIDDLLNNTHIFTLRACGMGYKDDKKDLACYYVLKERRDGGFEVIQNLVPYNRNMMKSNIISSSIPDKTPILSKTNLL